MIRTYTELLTIDNFMDRFRYLQLWGEVGKDTFGFDRYMNQNFYRSREWKSIRDYVIVRDNGCDLGVTGRELYSKILIHHMNPISVNDIKFSSEYLMNPEYLICTSHQTHNAIHYGDTDLLIADPIERTPNDTCPWRKETK